MQILLIVLCILALLFLLLIAAISIIMARTLIRPPRDTRAKAELLEIERGNLVEGELVQYETEVNEVESFDGLPLKYWWLDPAASSNKAVVLAHGFGSRHEHMLKYAKLYLQRGYHVLLFDHRNSGESGGKYTTMGYLERRDLAQMLSIARKRMGSGGIVGTHGESMGGATVVLNACMDNPPDFVVADCPYADLADQVMHSTEVLEFLPKRLPRRIAAGIVHRRAGFAYADVSPWRELQAKNGLPDLPMMFAHGDADDFVPCASSYKLFEVKQGKKKLYICEGAPHARSIAKDRERYREELFGFLDDYGF